MSTTKNATTKKNNQPYLDAWMNSNPDMKSFVSGTQKVGGAVNNVLPEGASREEQDVAQVYQSAYNNAVAIDKRAQNAVLEANKAHDLSMKYLAAQNEVNGLGGLGIADTSSLRLSSQYQKALTDAYATKEASLLENYQKMTEDASTIRGEWASREEAKADEKYLNTENAILASDSEDSVKDYLQATGYEEGTEEYNSLLNRWYLLYGKTEDKKEEIEGTTRNTVDALIESGGITENDIDNYNVDREKEVLNPQTITATGIMSKMDVKSGDEQTKYLNRILELSKTWGEDMNGTLVDFNYGAGDKAHIYLFYNGKWYKTKYTRRSASRSEYKNRFYSQANTKGEARGNDFYSHFGQTNG